MEIPHVVKISNANFAKLQEALLKAQNDGYGPDAAAAIALKAVGLPLRPTKLVVVDDADDN